MSGTPTRVALAQYAPGRSTAENLRDIATVAQQAHDSGASVLVLPEYSQAFIPGGGPSWAAVAEGLDGPFIQGLTALSAESGGMVIMAGMLVAHPDSLPRNTIVAVGPDGVMARAEKVHLYDAFGSTESLSVSPGELATPEILDIGGLRWGFMACYDLRFAEVARRLTDAGASCIVVPAQWVPGPRKIEQWKTLLAARAIENQSFVVAAGHPGPEGIGHTMACDPRGEIIGGLADGAGLLMVELDPTLVTEVRHHNPMASARRLGVQPLDR
jgi:deaminated glutathione amidase